MVHHATIADVARRANTTAATVSRVINNSGYVSPATRQAVLDAIEALHYMPNAHARALKTKRSRVIGLVTGDLQNPYAVALAQSVQDAAADRGYIPFIATASGDDPASEVGVIETFYRQRVAGLVVASVPTPESDRLLLRLAELRFPVVVVGRTLEHDRVDSISASYQRGGAAATQHLVELGHRRIAFVGATLEEEDRVKRLRGYLEAMRQAGLPIRREYIVGSERLSRSPRYSTQLTGYQAARRLLALPSRPTAIFARNDYTALGAMQAVKEAGLRVPDDMAIAGFDNTPMAAAMSPALTSVSQPTEEEGRLAAEFLVSRIERPEEELPRREMLLECHLIVRASTAPPPRGGRTAGDPGRLVDARG